MDKIVVALLLFLLLAGVVVALLGHHLGIVLVSALFGVW